MSEIGRNEPGPCGSGRKYKKCCLAKGTATALSGAHTAGERQSALDMLFRFGRRAEFEEARSVARPGRDDAPGAAEASPGELG
jgi:hypothetical protein